MGGHIFDHIQGHIKGVFRPGVVPSGSGASAYTPSERIGNTDFSSAGNGWIVSGLDPYWDFTGDVATALYVPPSYVLDKSMYYIFDEPVDAGKDYEFSITVSDNVGDQSGLRIFLYSGSTLVNTIVTNDTFPVGVYTASGTTIGEVDRIVVYCNALSVSPGIVVTNVSFTA